MKTLYANTAKLFTGLADCLIKQLLQDMALSSNLNLSYRHICQFIFSEEF